MWEYHEDVRVPEWASVWTPLLAAGVEGSSEYQYKLGVRAFLEYLEEEYQKPVETAREIDNALAEFGWYTFETMAGRGRNRPNNATFGVEHFMPALKKKMVLNLLHNYNDREKMF